MRQTMVLAYMLNALIGAAITGLWQVWHPDRSLARFLVAFVLTTVPWAVLAAIVVRRDERRSRVATRR